MFAGAPRNHQRRIPESVLCSWSTITLSKYCYLRLTFHLFSTLPEASSPSHFSPPAGATHIFQKRHPLRTAAGRIVRCCLANLPKSERRSISSDFLTRALLRARRVDASNGCCAQTAVRCNLSRP